ncbi:MAG: ribosome biogenesis GTP-binding protein YihA/YsxC [Deferribacteraceae bacterium]|jgi:GTP-binding protein|nr:ribosome biogenesis GTP-binding protein YihA/YsxC [Deferribacteraceae bacterium]
MQSSFFISVADIKQLPPPLYPEVAFAGRSNVGKSSLMNKLLERKQLVKTGKTPGKTRLLNFFNINDQAMFVDLPGYGYAAVSKAETSKWGRLLDGYFQTRKNLAMCLILVDIRRSFEEEEATLYDLLLRYNIAPCIVLTKSDKLSKNQLLNNKVRISKDTGIPVEQLIHFSATTGDGRDAVRNAITQEVLISWD